VPGGVVVAAVVVVVVVVLVVVVVVVVVLPQEAKTIEKTIKHDTSIQMIPFFICTSYLFYQDLWRDECNPDYVVL
jgi:archaellum biogenesis protein FlaJ (TadC family)